MVIAHIVNDDGGVGNVVANLANSQVKCNVVYVYTSNGKQKFIKKLESAVQVKVIKSTFLPPIITGVGINMIYKELKHENPNDEIVMHAHNVVTVGLLSRLKNVPILCTIHGLSTFPEAKRTIRVKIQEFAISCIIKKIKNNIGVVVGVSHHTSEYYGKKSKQHIETIFNGSPRSGEKKVLSKEFTFAHVGDISDNKGWPIELAAFARLKQQNMSIPMRFICAGRLLKFTNEDVEKMIFGSGLSTSDVQYLGLVDNVDRDILSKTHVLLLASKSEGLPMCVIEAQSMGIPVLSTDVGGVSEIITNGVNGFLLERSIEAFSEKMSQLINDPELYSLMEKESLCKYENCFSDCRMVAEYERYYRKILSKVI